MADTNQRPRGGMTLDAISFGQGVFPPWPEKFRDVSRPVGLAEFGVSGKLR